MIVEVLAFYLLYAFTATVLIWRYGVKDRIPLIIVAWLVLPVVVVSLFHAIILFVLGKGPKIAPCPHGLEEAEAVVSRVRKEMFGSTEPESHYAQEWGALYRFTLDQDSQRVQKIARKLLAAA